MKIYLETYGCTANKSDTNLMRGLLKKHNFTIVDSPTGADVLILVTCTVIAATEQRMLARLKSLRNAHKRIIVAGCMAAVQQDLIHSIVPDAQLLPPKYIHHLVDILQGKNTFVFTEKRKTYIPKIFPDCIAQISISEGCNSSCSYCITHHARGQLMSYQIDDIVHDVTSALTQGCKEIQLTAQDTASYGLDIGTNLAVLLEKICTIDEPFRIRVGMMNPYTTLTHLDSIIQSYKDKKIYKFIHLPVQSGDDELLQLMERKYTCKDFYRIITTFQKTFTDLLISTDIIVGFPTETDEQFKRTIDLLKTIQPDIVNITRFSARPQTLAKKLKGRIPTEIVKQRSRVLTDLFSQINKQKIKKHLGKRHIVLITEKGKNNTMMGRAENYKPVILKEFVQIGKFYDVEIIDASAVNLVGKLI